MSSRRQAAVDKLDRTITRLYTYLSGSEGEEAESSPAQRRPVNITQRGCGPAASAVNTATSSNSVAGTHRYRDEPEYQQPYAYPPSHAVPYNPYGQTNFGLGGQMNDTPTSDHTGSDVTFTESELALTHESTLPISNGESFIFVGNRNGRWMKPGRMLPPAGSPTT